MRPVPPRRRDLAFAMCTAAACALLLTAASQARAQLVINELEYDEAGADGGEFIELANTGPSAIDLSGYSLSFINGAVSPPSAYRSIVLGPGLLAAGAYYVVCADAATVSPCDLDSSPNTNWVQNGPNDAAVLRYNGVDVDRLAYDGELAGFTEGSGATADPGGAAAEGLSRCPDGSDSDDNASDFRVAANTPGAANACGGGGRPLGACGDPATNIGAVQGDGITSPLAGSAVVIEGVVVANFQASSLDGFYVQEEDADQDGDPNTSDGVFVFQGDLALSVAVGNRVRVAGTVTEFDNVTELSAVSAALVCPAGAPASARTLNLPDDGVDLERFEGMLVHIPQRLTVTGNYELGRYGTLDLSVGGRLYQPTQVAAKGSAALAVAQDNDLRRIVLDDGSSVQNPNPIPYKDEHATRRTGDMLPSLTGVLDQRFGAYRVQPTQAPVFASDNPRPPAPQVPGRLHVASANLLNYFTTLDDGQPHCGPAGDLECRGADSAPELARQRAKLVNELGALDADVVGLLELQNDGSTTLQDLVDGLNAALGAGSYAFVDTGTIGSDAIKVGLLYKPATVEPLGSFAVLTTGVDSRFLDTKNRPVLAQTFAELSSGARFTVAVNHWKSKGSACDDVGDPDLNDGQGNCNLTRSAAAKAVTDWLAGDPTDSGDPDVLLVGDFNAYAMEDPIALLQAAGYGSLERQFTTPPGYSYQYQGQFGSLDHALANTTLAEQVVGFAHFHANADEPRVLDYNTELKTDDPFDASDPFRASDHDPLLVGLDLTAAPAVPATGCFWHWLLAAAGLGVMGAIGAGSVRRRG